MAIHDSFCLEISDRDYMDMTEGLQTEYSNYNLPNTIRMSCQHPCYKEIRSFKRVSARQQSGNSPPSEILAFMRKTSDFKLM